MSQSVAAEQAKMPRIFALNNENCIRCASCSSIAPANFAVADDGAYILKQPDNALELKQCETALINCPTRAISLLD